MRPKSKVGANDEADCRQCCTDLRTESMPKTLLHQMSIAKVSVGQLESYHLMPMCAVQALLLTSGQQQIAKSLEDAVAGRYRNRVSPAVVDAELRAARDQQLQLVAAITSSMSLSPELQPALERILGRSAAVVSNIA